jgi:diketogulonate reductase-like aldo/keto reductase
MLRRAMASLDINSKLRMNSGYEIPILGYGVSARLQLKWIYAKFLSRSTKRKSNLVGLEWHGHDAYWLWRPPNECEAVVKNALKTGYRHVSFLSYNENNRH